VAADEVEVRRGRRSVGLTHLDRMYWPDVGLRKRDLVDYYRAVAPVLLPHLRGRPQTLRRHYTVPRGPFVWEKDAAAEIPDWFKTVSLPAKSRRGAPVRYAVVDDELSLLWLVEYGCIDFHVGTARADLPERPDFVLFDLDPAGVAFEHVVEAALLLREALSARGRLARGDDRRRGHARTCPDRAAAHPRRGTQLRDDGRRCRPQGAS
jgi:bifunctional non-homologous end joining protein LigD